MLICIGGFIISTLEPNRILINKSGVLIFRCNKKLFFVGVVATSRGGGGPSMFGDL